MRNQLCRYYETATTKYGLAVLKIVYVPLKNEEPRLYHDDEYADIAKTIEKDKLVYVLPAVNKDQKDLAHMFLDKCAKSNDEAKVFIEHYSRLVKRLGGDVMANNQDKNAVRTIFKNENAIDAANHVCQLMQDKLKLRSLLGEILGDELSKNENKYRFERHDKEMYFKHRLANGIYLVFLPEHCTFGIACSDAQIRESKDSFRNCFKTITGPHVSQPDEPAESYEKQRIAGSTLAWMWKNLEVTKFDTIENWHKRLIKFYDALAACTVLPKK